MADYAPVDLTAEGQVEFELNGRRVSAPAGTMLVDAAYAHGVEVPIFCYEPRLGAADRRLPHVPGRDRGDARPADRLQHARAAGHGRAHQLRDRQGRPGRRAGVPAREPPARLPGLRQGRRVPPAGPHLPLRPGAHALRRAQAPLPEAARPVVGDRARPRALHLLLPLRALQPGRRRGQGARHGAAGRRRRDRDAAPATSTRAASPATSSTSARSAPSRASPTASSRGPGTSRTPRRSAATTPPAPTWS